MDIFKWIKPKSKYEFNGFFGSIIKMTFTKNTSNMSQAPPNPGFRSVKVDN